jgi:hypothetical protein
MPTLLGLSTARTLARRAGRVALALSSREPMGRDEIGPLVREDESLNILSRRQGQQILSTRYPRTQRHHLPRAAGHNTLDMIGPHRKRLLDLLRV